MVHRVSGNPGLIQVSSGLVDAGLSGHPFGQLLEVVAGVLQLGLDAGQLELGGLALPGRAVLLPPGLFPVGAGVVQRGAGQRWQHGDGLAAHGAVVAGMEPLGQGGGGQLGAGQLKRRLGLSGRGRGLLVFELGVTMALLGGG